MRIMKLPTHPIGEQYEQLRLRRDKFYVEQKAGPTTNTQKTPRL